MPLKPPDTAPVVIRHLYHIHGYSYFDIKIRADLTPRWPAHIPPEDVIDRIGKAVLAAIAEEGSA